MSADSDKKQNGETDREKVDDKQDTGEEGAGIGATLPFVQPVDGWPEGTTDARTDITTEPQMADHVTYGIMSNTQAITSCSKSHPSIVTPHHPQ